MRSSMIWIGLGIILFFTLCACEPLPPPPLPPGASSATITPKPTVTLVATQLSLKELWEESKHANTYVIENGAHNECARCHSPANWIPTSPEDMPATCATCKFTIKTPKPVEKADWKNIGCEQCHRVEKETVTQAVAWRNPALANFDPSSDPYETVKTNTELCEKCHRDTYKIEMGKSAHANKTCTDCHDPHSTRASCTTAQCHPNVLKPTQPIVGHDTAHANVHCVACHDAGGWKVQPTGDKKTWLTLRPTDLKGNPNPIPYTSHNLQKTVDCARCHFAGNPWNLKTITP